jgi:hypothetical protein
VTPTLSEAADHERLISEDDVAVALRLVGASGSSESPVVVNVTVMVVDAVMPAESRTVKVMTLSPRARSTFSVCQEVVPNATPCPPRLLDHVVIFMVFPENGVAVPQKNRVGLVVVKLPVVEGSAMDMPGGVRFAFRGTFQKESLIVVAPPDNEPVAQDEPVAMTMNWVAVDVTGAFWTDHEVVPVADA